MSSQPCKHADLERQLLGRAQAIDALCQKSFDVGRQEGGARSGIESSWKVDHAELADQATVITDALPIHLLLLLQMDSQLRDTLISF